MEETVAQCALETAKAFVSRAPVGMSLLGLDGTVIAMSPSVAPWSELPTDLLGERISDSWVEAARHFNQVLEQLRDGAPVVEIEQATPRPDGSLLQTRSQVSYWRDDDGQPVAVLCVMQNIEAEIEARTALKRTASQLRAVVENIPVQISVMDIETGRISLMNSRMREGLAAYTGAQEGGLRDEVLGAVDLAELEHKVAEAEAAGGPIYYEVSHTSGALARSTFRMSYLCYRDHEDRKHLLFTAEDITELRKSAEALKQAAEAAEAANRAKSEFLANMSHEIRTPLNGVMGVAGALARTELSPSQREMVSLVETSAKTLETLLSDILDLARIEAGRM
jgi:PAS domain S-box-containing protein